MSKWQMLNKVSKKQNLSIQVHRNKIIRDIPSDSEAEELDIEDGETDNFGDDERDSLGQPSPRRVTSGSGASLNRDDFRGKLLR